MSNIKISYIWDKEIYLKATKIAYDYELKRSSKRFIGWIFIAMSQFGVVQAMKGGGVGLLLLSSILILYWYYFRWEIRKSILIKNFKKSPNANHKFNILANEKGITIDDRLIQWSKIEEIISLRDGFLLYYDNSFLFFPLNAFKDIEKKNQFGLLVKANIKAKE
jgi:hypothetical protein